MAQCLARRPGCGHAARVETYRDWRLAWKLRREAENPGMYPAEVAEWEEMNPAPTFGRFLLDTRTTV